MRYYPDRLQPYTVWRNRKVYKFFETWEQAHYYCIDGGHERESDYLDVYGRGYLVGVGV